MIEDEISLPGEDWRPDDFRRTVDRLLNAHERFMDRECLSLYAGTNIPNPRVTRCQASTVGSRPSLGPPGDKYETGLRYNGIRLGTQEITRWGMTPSDMPAVARLIGRVLLEDEPPERVKDDVIALRQRFQRLHFVRESD